MPHDEFLTTDQLVARWAGQVKKGTIQNWRSRNCGPPFVKVGMKVLYPLKDLQDWEASNKRAVNDNNAARNAA